MQAPQRMRYNQGHPNNIVKTVVGQGHRKQKNFQKMAFTRRESPGSNSPSSIRRSHSGGPIIPLFVLQRIARCKRAALMFGSRSWQSKDILPFERDVAAAVIVVVHVKDQSEESLFGAKTVV